MGLDAYVGKMIMKAVQKLIKEQAGITVVHEGEEGSKTPADDVVVVRDYRFYWRVIVGGTLAFGETFMDELWTCGSLFKVLKIGALKSVSTSSPLQRRIKFWYYFFDRFVNPQSIWRSVKVAKLHYDLGNDLYEKMLDPFMQYTCGYWKDLTRFNSTSLEASQIAKLDLIGRKMYLKPGMEVLELGGGFGGLSYYLAKNFGVKMTVCDLSEEHIKYAGAKFKHDNVSMVLKDYRLFCDELQAAGRAFDRVVSVGMLEHVGPRNFPTLFRKVWKVCKRDGLFLLHSIGNSEDDPVCDPWFDKYIFPGCVIPGPQTLFQSGCIGDGWKIEDWHNFGVDYQHTCLAWRETAFAARDQLPAKYDAKFWRMWDYYLTASAAGFGARSIHLWQLVLSPDGFPSTDSPSEGRGGYISIR